MVNTLKYVKMLEAVGFSRNQAETSIRILVETMEDRLATKEDLKDLEVRLLHSFSDHKTETQHSFLDHKTEMQHSFSEFRAEMNHSFSEFRAEMQHSIIQVESRLTIRMGAMLAASIAILTAIQKLT
jgi:hypothetical protein